jgi:hypothetical protein
MSDSGWLNWRAFAKARSRKDSMGQLYEWRLLESGVRITVLRQ